MFKNVLKSKSGEGSIETAISLIVSIIVGGLILIGVTSLVDSNIGPAIEQTFQQQENVSISNTVSLGSTSVTAYALGDVNRDSLIDEEDADYLKRYLAGWEGYEVDREQSDIDKDGNIDDRDMKLLQYLINGEPLPAEEG